MILCFCIKDEVKKKKANIYFLCIYASTSTSILASAISTIAKKKIF